jgi:hypothetical protein
MMSVITLSVIMLSVIMLSVIMLSVITLSVIMRHSFECHVEFRGADIDNIFCSG